MPKVIIFLRKNDYFDKNSDFSNIYPTKASPIVLFEKGPLYKMYTLLTEESPQKCFPVHNPFIPFIPTLLSYI